MKYDKGYELFGIPIPDSIGELIEEVFYGPSWTTKIVWLTIGMVLAGLCTVLAIYLSYT